jgi:hypothetical protein
LNIPLLGVILLVLGGAAASVLLYTQTVNLRHEITASKQELEELREANAEYRSDLFAALDAERLSAVALELGFVRESSPRYIPVISLNLAAEL